MSAFIVNNEHINAIVNYANRVLGPMVDSDEPDAEWYHDPKALGQLLLDENVRSFNYRYREQIPFIRFQWTPTIRLHSAVQIIKAVRCLMYQSCESPDWESTPAKKILDRIMHVAIVRLPGYVEANWEITEREGARHRP